VPAGESLANQIPVTPCNTYDYADGVKPANLLARLVITNVRLPVRARSAPALRPSRSQGASCEAGCTIRVVCPTTMPMSSCVSAGAPDTRSWPGDLAQPREPDRRPLTICGHQRPGQVGLWQRRLVAALGSAGQQSRRFPAPVTSRCAIQGTSPRWRPPTIGRGSSSATRSSGRRSPSGDWSCSSSKAPGFPMAAAGRVILLSREAVA
jgi:hypothetical protein